MQSISAVKLLLVCVAVLIGLLAAAVAAALPSRPQPSWASRVRAGAAAFAVTVPTVLVTMSAAGLL